MIRFHSRSHPRLAEFVLRSGLDLRPQTYHGGGKPNYYSLVLRPTAGRSSKEIGYRLSVNGVVSDIFRFGGEALNEMPYFSKYKTQETPNSRAALNTFVTLPVHEGLTDDDLQRIENALSEAVKADE